MALFVTACATPYISRPIVMVGPGFNAVEYEAALQECRQMVLKQTDYQQANDAVSRALGGALLGAALGAALGASVGRAGMGATVGTVGGAAGGVGSYGQLAEQRQQVFNQALAGCLAAKGYQVLGVGR